MWVRLCLKYDIHILNEKLTKFRVREDEDNVSGDKISTHVRINFEILHLLDHYLDIEDVGFFLEVFPDAEKFRILKPNMIPYFLSMLAYETELRHMQLWALDTLFNFMQSDKIVDELKKDYNFSYPDFLEMSAKGDFSNIQLLNDKMVAINYLEATNAEKFETINNLEAINAEKVTAITNLEDNLNNLNDELLMRNKEILKKDKLIIDLKSNMKIFSNELKIKNKEIRGLEANINILARSRKSDLYKNFKILFSKYLSSEPIPKKGRLAQVSNIPYLFIILKSKGNLKNAWINIKGYRAIKGLGLFDEFYYLNRYKKVLISGMNPLIHYMYYGYKENKFPNSTFNGDEYLNVNEDVRNSNLNPLVHYSVYGIKEGRKGQENPETLEKQMKKPNIKLTKEKIKDNKLTNSKNFQKLDSLKLNIGCGDVKFHDWVNIDIEPGADLVVDLRNGLPLEDDSADFIYNEHFIEHLKFEDGEKTIKEFYRVLKKGGILRIATPDLDYLVKKYLNDWKNQDWLTWPEFEYIKTKGLMINISMRDWGHEYLYNEEDLRNLVKKAGFKRITKHKLNESSYSELSNRETREDSKLILEAEK